MTLSLIFFAALCGPVFGQSLPENAAAQSMRDRIGTLNLQPLQRAIVVAVTTPVCAIPLSTVVPSGSYRMPVVKPPAGFAREATHAGAPVCDMRRLQNR